MEGNGKVNFDTVQNIKLQASDIARVEVGIPEPVVGEWEYTFRLSDETVVSDLSTGSDAIDVTDIREVRIDTTNTSSQFIVSQSAAELQRQHMILFKQRKVAHGTSIRSFIGVCRDHFWNTFGAAYIASNPGDVIRLSGIPPTAPLLTGTCKPREWSLFLHGVALDISGKCASFLQLCTSNRHLSFPPPASVPSFDTTSLDVLTGGAGSMFAELSSAVVHAQDPAVFHDEIMGHVDLAPPIEQEKAAEEAAKFKKLYKAVYGIDI